MGSLNWLPREPHCLPDPSPARQCFSHEAQMAGARPSLSEARRDPGRAARCHPKWSGKLGTCPSQRSEEGQLGMRPRPLKDLADGSWPGTPRRPLPYPAEGLWLEARAWTQTQSDTWAWGQLREAGPGTLSCAVLSQVVEPRSHKLRRWAWHGCGALPRERRCPQGLQGPQKRCTGQS